MSGFSRLVHGARAFVARFAQATRGNVAMMFGLALLALCDEVWVFGKEHSEGMTAEIVEAKRLNKPMRYYSEEVVL